MTPLSPEVLPGGIRSRLVSGVNGMTVHVLEAGDGAPERPCLLLLHGFPELAYSWRRVMPALADAGYYVVAPDLRGHGRTSGTDATYDDDLAPHRMTNLVRDQIGLLYALGRRSVAAVAGHDFGSPVAAWCAMIRPDIFRAVALMSAPFAGPPGIPFATDAPPRAAEDVHAALARLDRPRKHYQWYYATRRANEDMWRAPQGVHGFLRAYYHHKSADWAGNEPHPLTGWTATELAKMPTYYIMDLRETMAETVAKEMPSAEAIAANHWLPDEALAVYAAEYGRNGFQGGLQNYRIGTGRHFESDLELFAGRAIDVPSVFIAGASDWGIHQRPGAVERMQRAGCSRMLGCHLVGGAGHWVQQEQPKRTVALLLDFLRGAAA